MRFGKRGQLLLVVALGVQMSALVRAQDVDTTPPQLVNFSFSPTSIDVSAGPQTVTATFEATDDLAGTSFVQVQFLSPSGGQFQFFGSSGRSRATG